MARKKGDYPKTLSHAAMALLLATPAAAQERAGGRVSADASAAETDLSEELIVTARRQSENITDVPAKVHVVSDEALRTQLVGAGLDLTGIQSGCPPYKSLGGYWERGVG